MKKILVATEKPFSPVAIDKIKKVLEGGDYNLVLLEKYTDKSQLLEAVKDADAMIVRSDKITAEVLDAAKQLKIVVRAGAGTDAIDLVHAKEKGIVVENTPGQNANAVAELVFSLAIMVKRNFFDGTSGSELMEKTIGIHGFGNVGRNVARIAKGIGMNILAYDVFANPAANPEVTFVDSVEELYSKSDFISMHIPALPDTIKSINYDLVMKMPKKAVLINGARGEVIDDESLLKALQERPDLTYVTDIKPTNHEEYLKLPAHQYFATPKKMGAQTAEANINAGVAGARQIRNFFENGDEKFRVNK